MILNSRRIGLYWMSLTLILTLSITPMSRSEEITSFEEFFKGYEKVWEVPLGVSVSPIDLLPQISDSSFGFLVPGNKPGENSIFKSFDKSGNLLWNTGKFSERHGMVIMSRSGNRYLILRWNEDNSSSYTEIYNSHGEFLHKCEIGGLRFLTSPEGKYYYSIPGIGDYNPLIVTDEMCKKLYKRNPEAGAFWLAVMPNDTLLIYLDQSEISTIKAGKWEALQSRKIKSFEYDLDHVGNLNYSGNGDKIAIWGLDKICILDSDLEVKGYITTEPNVWFKNVLFMEGVNLIAVIIDNLNLLRRRIDIYSEEGLLIDKLVVECPWGEKIALGKELSYSNGHIISRFITVGSSDNPPEYRIRSLLLNLDIETGKILQSNFAETWIYPWDDDFIEIDQNRIRYWLRKESK